MWTLFQNLSRSGHAPILFRNKYSVEWPLKDRFNIAPTQYVPVIVAYAKPELAELYWGLIPSWVRDMSMAPRNINARAETVDEKPMFRNAFKKRHCLVPASGFYEWKKSEDGKIKTPYYFTAADGSPLMLAGLWESWNGMGQEIPSFTIITAEANETVAPLHDRMPVIIPPDKYDEWLYPSSMSKDLLAPAPNDLLQYWEVSKSVESGRFLIAGTLAYAAHAEFEICFKLFTDGAARGDAGTVVVVGLTEFSFLLHRASFFFPPIRPVCNRSRSLSPIASRKWPCHTARP